MLDLVRPLHKVLSSSDDVTLFDSHYMDIDYETTWGGGLEKSP